MVTQPDRKRGRGLHVSPTLVKETAKALGIRVFQPAVINTAAALHFLKDLKADLFVIVAYGQILSQEIIDVPRLMAINAHASLLPRYRGAAPINQAIIDGEKVTGVTVMKVIRKMDSGPVILRQEAAVKEEDTALTLESRLSHIAAGALIESLSSIADKTYTLSPQDETAATYAPKLKKGDGLIDWAAPAPGVYNLIRGCLGWPGAFTFYKGKMLKIYKVRAEAAAVETGPHRPGELVRLSRDGVTVACGKGGIVIQELQMEGRRVMTAEEFLAGHKIHAGETFGKK